MRKLIGGWLFFIGVVFIGAAWGASQIRLCGAGDSGDEFIAVEVMPALVYEEQPEYPAEAKAAGIEGKAVITLRVGTDGSVSGVRVKESSGSNLLDKAARMAADKYRFRPAVQDGKLVSVWVCITVDFVLDPKKADKPSPMIFKAIGTGPELIKQVQPTYPPEAIAGKIEGKAYIGLLVDPSGRVIKTRLAKSSGNKLLDDAAVNAGRDFLFKPAEQKGDSVAVWVTLPIIFTLERR